MTSILLLSLLLIPTSALCCYRLAHGLASRSVGQHIRDVGPQTHAVKAGTPTMGGLVVLLLWVGGVVLLGILLEWPPSCGFILASGVCYGAMGLLDDALSLRRKRSMGLGGLQKIVLGSLIAVGLFVAFRNQILVPQRIPFTQHQLGLPWIAMFFLHWILFLAVTNSANLTDGLDGLAGSVSLLVLGGFLIISPSLGNALLLLPLMAALLGFLWLNAYPADLFLGDVGSFGLGGIIGAFALSQGLAFLLPLLAGVFVLEAGSVILQVGALRLTGRRAFKISPLHHHFEDAPRPGVDFMIPSPSWPETKVTMRFILLQVVFVVIAVWASVAWNGME